MKLKIKYIYYTVMAWILNTIASLSSKTLRVTGRASNLYEARQDTTRAEINWRRK